MTMRDYPHLPLLTLSQCFAAFEVAGVPLTKQHDLLGVSRMTVFKWRSGRSTPYPNVLHSVSTLAYKCLRAVDAKLLPLPKAATPVEIMKMLSDNDTRMELLDNIPAETLLAALPAENN